MFFFKSIIIISIISFTFIACNSSKEVTIDKPKDIPIKKEIVKKVSPKKKKVSILAVMVATQKTLKK